VDVRYVLLYLMQDHVKAKCAQHKSPPPPHPPPFAEHNRPLEALQPCPFSPLSHVIVFCDGEDQSYFMQFVMLSLV
jgi:hypothetical protein